MIVLLKLLLFVISTIGSFELIRRISNNKVNIYFLPSLIIAIQVTILFLAGILNLLYEATIELYLLGFVGIIYSIYKDKNISFLKNYINVGYTVFLILFLILAVYLKGKIFTHYDNFSHWALVVKKMLEVNRYPNFKDTLIKFQEYPLGSATYIYFFAKLTSESESVQMLAQCYMMLATILPLYSFVKKNKLAVSLVIVSFINYIFLYNIEITDLLVDTLLPLVGACALFFTYLHCKDGEKINYYLASFYMVQLIQIKNSGIFFVAFIVLQMIIFVRKNKDYHKLYLYVSIAIPFISLILWQKHCNYVYLSAEYSKHAMTISNFYDVFQGKAIDDIKQIFISLLKYMVSYKEVWITFGFIVLTGILIFLTRKELKKSFNKVLTFSIILYIVYGFGMLAMYIFSMPLNEAIGLASIDRYTKTILIAILYLNMVITVKIISELSDKKLVTITATLSFVSYFVGMYISSGSINTVVQNEVDSSERNWIVNVSTKYNVPMYETYCILIPSKDSGYTSYLCKYIFQTNDVTTIVVDSEDDLKEISSKYIFIYDQDNKIINSWVQANYPEQYGNEVIIQVEE
jgi:hypothetical protein